MNFIIVAVRNLGNDGFEEKNKNLIIGTTIEFGDAQVIAQEYHRSRGGKYGCFIWDVKTWKEVYRVNSWSN